jgi:subtilisin family serine protease
MKKTPLALGIFLLSILAGCKKDLNEPVAEAELDMATDQMFKSGVTQRYVPGELLVKFKEGSTTQRRSNALLRINATVEEQVVTAAMRQAGDNEGFYLVKTAMDPMEAMKTMKGSADIEYAEPNWIYTYDAASTDPYYTDGRLWGMKGGNGSNAEAAWTNGNIGLSSVYVGIIDEGIQFGHPDLAGQVWTNPHDLADGRDNDGNGYVDDVRGWDFANNDNSIYDGGTNGRQDDHGTHVAGTIGAKANNSGVVGVNWNITLISGKFLGRNGGTTANAIRAVDYFTNLKTKGLNIVATNNSWGGGGYSQGLYDAINRANAAGILFVAAAGNGGSDGIGDNNDAIQSYPSNYELPNVIAVAAIDRNGALARFSNYGAKKVHIGAPGVGIYSTTAYNLYESYSGTSMATPHVTGACALYASVKTNPSAQTIKNAVLSSAAPTASLSGKTTTGGRLDANAALSK